MQKLIHWLCMRFIVIIIKLVFFILYTSLVAKIFVFYKKNARYDVYDMMIMITQKTTIHDGQKNNIALKCEHYDHDHKMILSCTIADNDEDKNLLWNNLRSCVS